MNKNFMDLKFIHICFEKLELGYIFKNLGWSYVCCTEKEMHKYKDILWYSGNYKFLNELEVVQDLRIFCATSLDGKFCFYLFFIRVNLIKDNKVTVNFRQNIFRKFAIRRGGFLSDVTDLKINTYAGKCPNNFKKYYAFYFELEDIFINKKKIETLSISNNLKIASKFLSYPTETILKHNSIYVDI